MVNTTTANAGRLLLAIACFIMACSEANTKKDNTGAATTAVSSGSDSSAITRGYFFTEQSVSFPECHASTILHLPNGEFLAAWFGGKKEGTDDVGIWLTRGKPGNWEAPVEVAKNKRGCTLEPGAFSITRRQNIPVL